jgi:glutathione S-transferase
MLTLYYSPGACSLSPHIVLREAGLAFELDKVSFGTKKTSDGGDFLAVNPKGSVPVLRLDDGQVLTEGPAIVQYLADLNPSAKLAPPAGTMERYRLQEWLNFITSELHKGFSPLFAKDTPADYKPIVTERLLSRLAIVDRALEGRSFLLGEQFTVADAYLFVVTNWAAFVGLDIARFADLAAFRARVAERPAVQAAMAAEGLNKRA